MKLMVICILLTPALLLLSCLYDSDYPLKNYNPRFISHSIIEQDLIFPDSIVCTLSVSDLNDKKLSLAVLSCSYPESCDSILDTVSWPGNYFWLNDAYGTKPVLLTLNTNLLGFYTGSLILSDQSNAKAAIPFQIRKLFYEPFNSDSSLIINWKKHRTKDSNTVKFDYFTEPKLLFIFSTAIGDSSEPLSTGITSRFSLSGDFHITVDFKLRDEMTDGFEIAFYVSTSPDTGKWQGEKAGTFINGSHGSMRLECKSIDLQSYSREITLYSGELGISRSGSHIEFYYHDGNPQVTPQSLITHDFISDDSIYVHIKMTVEDRVRYRHCLWNDFYVVQGQINF